MKRAKDTWLTDVMFICLMVSVILAHVVTLIRETRLHQLEQRMETIEAKLGE